jgi:hypothetical protein
LVPTDYVCAERLTSELGREKLPQVLNCLIHNLVQHPEDPAEPRNSMPTTILSFQHSSQR